MQRLGCIITAFIVIAAFIFLFVPLWEIPYFDIFGKPLKYELTSYIERGKSGEKAEGMIGDWSDNAAKSFNLVDGEYIVPYDFPIVHIVIKNIETPVPKEIVFSEEDKARLALLTEKYGQAESVYEQHFSKSAWERKPLWERVGREIIARILFSNIWQRYIPAFEYGITLEDWRVISFPLIGEKAVLESKRDTNSPASFKVTATFHASGHIYSDICVVNLAPNEAQTVEFRVYQINIDEDKWSWNYEVSPARKWVTRYKKVPLLVYLEWVLSRF